MLHPPSIALWTLGSRVDRATTCPDARILVPVLTWFVVVAVIVACGVGFALLRRRRPLPAVAPPPSSVVPVICYDDGEDADVTELSAFAERAERDGVVVSGHAFAERSEEHVLRATVSGASWTQRGARRTENQDAVAALTEIGLFVVADGVGGQAAGDRASRSAIAHLAEALERGVEPLDLAGADALPRDAVTFARAVCVANRAVHEEAQREPAARGMCTTLTALRLSEVGQHAYVMHVGDSRCYRVRAGRAEVLTKDHVRDGKLTRAVGVAKNILVDAVIVPVEVGDVFVLCSDGLVKSLRDEDIAEAVRDTSAEKAARRLTELAESRGAADDLGVVVVEVRLVVVGVPDMTPFGRGGLGLR